MRIVNWEKYQLYKHKSMPWFKLYGRDLLNDLDWHLLNCSEKSTLLELWCLASENQGWLPDMNNVAFRLRKNIEVLEPILKSLIDKNWVTLSDIKDEIIEPVQDQYSINMLDKIRIDKDINIDKDKEYSDEFIIFWENYPRKVGKQDAYKSWKKNKPNLTDILNALVWQTKTNQWFVENGKYIPHPATYLNQHRWLDEPDKGVSF